MAIYDYKKNYVLKFPCCKKGNMTLCLKIVILVVGWLIVIIFGYAVLLFADRTIKIYIAPIIEWMVDHIDEIINIIALLL